MKTEDLKQGEHYCLMGSGAFFAPVVYRGENPGDTGTFIYVFDGLDNVTHYLSAEMVMHRICDI